MDEAIKNCEDIAEDLEKREKIAREADWKYANFCKERAENNRQFAEWLKNYKRLLSLLDDIKAEIEDAKIDVDIDFGNETLYNNAIDDVLEIIDKKVKEYRNG